MIQYRRRRCSLRCYLPALCFFLFMPDYAEARAPEESRRDGSAAFGSRAEGEVVLAAENIEEQDDDGFGVQAAPRDGSGVKPPGAPKERFARRVFRTFIRFCLRMPPHRILRY